jgi:hypothetical protein
LLTDFLSLENPILEEVKVTEIDWKEGKNVCRKVVTNKKAKKGKPKKKNVECKSFFRFFSKPLSNEDVYSKEDEEEDFGDRMDMTEDEDFTIAQIFRLDVIPNALLWFTGEAKSSYAFDDADDEDA